MLKKLRENRKLREIARWMAAEGEAEEESYINITELIVKVNGWTCECCGSAKDLDAYHLELDKNSNIIDSTSENLICLCPKCYKKYHENPIEALHHMTNPQVFKFPAKDPRLEKYCK